MTHRSAIALVLVTALLTVACGGEGGTAAQERGPGGRGDEPPKTVRVARAEQQGLSQTVMVSGTLDAFDRATVGTKVAGRLASIAVDLGSPVRRGQVVAKLDATDYQIRVQQAEAGLAQARARLGLDPAGGDDGVDPQQTGTVREARAVMEEAKTNRERYASLLGSGLVSKADFDSVQAAARVAESRYQDAIEEIRNRQAVLSQRRAELALARQQLADTVLYASFDGVVQSRAASIGEFLAAGAPVAEIVRVNPLRFRADVPERDAAFVRPGQAVRLTVDGAGREYGGRITRVAPTISERTRVLQVEADITNDGTLRGGSFARAAIVTESTQPAIVVPAEALTTFAGIQKVVIVEKGKANEKPVSTGRRAGGVVEILDGVKPGDEVVLNPVNLRSGQQVQVTR